MRKGRLKAGRWVGIGLALGVALGAAMDNVGIGIALGIAIGAAMDHREAGSTEESDEDSQ